MKNIFFLFSIIFFFFTSFSQDEVWEQLPQNSAVLTGATYDIEMVNGEIFQFINQNDGANNTSVYKFIKSTDSWQFLNFVASTSITKLISQKIGDLVYLVGYDGANFSFWKYQYPAMNPIQEVQNYPVANVNDNWEFETGKNADELYILYTVGTGPSVVYGLERNPGFTWNTMSENSTQDLSTAKLQIQSTDTKVFFGVASGTLKMTFFNKGAIQTMFSYAGVAGEVFTDAANFDSKGIAIVGNLNDNVTLYATEDNNNLTYEKEIIPNTVIDFNTTTDPITNYNVNENYLAKESSPSHAFIGSQFSANGLGNPSEQFFVIRKDISQGSTIWDTVATRVLPFGTQLDANSMRLSIDNNYKHISTAYIQNGNSIPDISVSNKTPYVNNSSINANSGLCPGNMNEIYSQVEFFDDDNDQITITDFYSLNLETTNIQIIPTGYSNGSSKFKVLGVPSANTDYIVIIYTDGYGSYSQTLNPFTAASTPINLDFISDPLLFCSNETQIDLSDKVNYYDQGRFKLNGQTLDNTLINANLLESISQTGIVRYTVNVNGCFVSNTANYQIVNPPSATIISNPTSCGNATGTASATIIPGTSPNTNFYWSTGETALAINALNPGAYYLNIVDDNSCKSIIPALIESSDITISETITNPSCFDSQNGSIQLTVSSPNPYQLIWLNGTNGPDLNNIGPGNYQVNYYDVTGCNLTKTFQVSSPSQILNNFNLVKPTCGQLDGAITSNVTGGSGVGTYNYLWNNSSITTNLANISQGFYTLTVTDANGCIFKDSVHLNDVDGIIILDSLLLPSCYNNNGGINTTLIETANSGSVQSILWSTGDETEDIYDLASDNYFMTVTSSNNCISQKSFTLLNQAPLKNNICVVTVDLQSSTNLVVWEKAEETGVSHYNIYRENNIADSYSLIDTVQYSNLSVFNDVVASPLDRSWRYRISAVNECGIEGPYSSNHKTLHLHTITQVAPGLVHIYWDHYEGLNSGQYIVNRFSDQNGWESLSPAVPFGSTPFFADSNTSGLTGLDYYVHLELQTVCTATFKAQDFNRTRSNKEKGIFNPGSGSEGYSNNGVIVLENENFDLNIYPNPFDQNLDISLKGQESITIQLIDVNGKKLFDKKCNSGITSLSTINLEKGIYFIKFPENGNFNTVKIIKN